MRVQGVQGSEGWVGGDLDGAGAGGEEEGGGGGGGGGGGEDYLVGLRSLGVGGEGGGGCGGGGDEDGDEGVVLGGDLLAFECLWGRGGSERWEGEVGVG